MNPPWGVVGYMQTTLVTRLFGALAMHRGASAALRRFVIQACFAGLKTHLGGQIPAFRLRTVLGQVQALTCERKGASERPLACFASVRGGQ